MKITIERKFSVTLCLSIFLLLFSLNQPVTYAAGYTYGDYYNNNLTNTTTGATQGPSISGNGAKIAFWSNTVSLGSNGTSKEIFIWTSPSTITKISTLASGDVDNTLPSINFTGNRVAYINASTNKSLMLWTSGGSTTPIATGSNDINACKISGNGTKVVFRSNKDFSIGGLDTSYELYLWDDPSTFTKITSTTSTYAPDTAFSINYDGTLVAFATKETTGTAFSGKNPDSPPNYELYLWNKSDLSTTQIASSSGGIGSIEPSVTSYTISTTTETTTMTKIAFVSDRDLSVGKNPDNNPEIFLWTYTGTYAANNTNALTQITSTSVSGGACRNPQISKDGKFITFVSNINIISDPKSLLTNGISAIFVWNSSGTITQVNTLGDYPVISSYTGLYESDDIKYGPRIAYASTADGSYNIYLATSTIPVPATSRWGLIILILVLVSLAVFMLKRRRQTSKGEV
ncbi:MAG: hypothetical protein NT096_17015 [Proteobacteria bacterium]|nr:hypothetical protein [Pseudomonadota bacterium]